MTDDGPARDLVVIRNLREDDLDPITAIDASAVGRRRDWFLAQKLRQALADTGIAVSLAAERDDHVVGFLLARLYYGEFGVVEPAAVLDVLAVHPDYRGGHIAAALIDQLRTNLLGLGIHALQTEVAWSQPDLVTFFQHEGFTIAPRLCLDLDLVRSRT
ncbi:MAG: GNAT family N-acetyltransferase [Acidobacteria bacterium]|nr:GNAT family N-acetyltransferase [Acidobacteriota bacterium]